MESKNLHDFQQDLIEDSSFIAWVKSDFVEDNDHWSSFIDTHMDQMDEINQAIRVVTNLDFAIKPRIDDNKLWARIEASTKQVHTEPKIRKINWKYIAGLAAAACLVGIFYFKPGFGTPENQVFKSSIAQKVTEAFPDGSAITLNAGSEASFNADNWVKERKVSLQGMAFFEVRKGTQFTVETPNGQVTVLGTSFSVDARNDNFEVICKTGKVAVKSKNGDEKILNPNDVATLRDGILMTHAMPKGTVGLIPWLEGGYTFFNEDFGQVVKEIENQFDIKVVMDPSLNNLKYTGFFKNNHLNDALFNITWPLKLKYKIEGKQAILTKE